MMALQRKSLEATVPNIDAVISDCASTISVEGVSLSASRIPETRRRVEKDMVATGEDLRTTCYHVVMRMCGEEAGKFLRQSELN